MIYVESKKRNGQLTSVWIFTVLAKVLLKVKSLTTLIAFAMF